jgi:N-acetylated-alpha-linked acidic dipeptidase
MCVRLIFLLTFCMMANSDWGSILRDLPSVARLIENEQVLSSQPHVAGSLGDRWLANFTYQRFLESKLENVVVDEQIVLLSKPISASVSMIFPAPYNASLFEPFIPEDPSTGDDRIICPFNAYSASGTVSAPLVYANYGRVEDYEDLLKAGVVVRNAIVLVRYGLLFRGLKVRIAQEQGALGVILYSDPQDDGFTRGPVFPNGPWRPSGSVQRGTAMFVSICPGDPRTPECGGQLFDHIPSIPVQPLSYGEASHFLAHMGGPVAPSSFQGGLLFQYTLGGQNLVTLSVNSSLIVCLFLLFLKKNHH